MKFKPRPKTPCRRRSRKASVEAKLELIIVWTAMSVTRKQMAGMLGLSVKMIDHYFTTIRKRLGASDPAFLARHCIFNGLLTEGDCKP